MYIKYLYILGVFISIYTYYIYIIIVYYIYLSILYKCFLLLCLIT